MTNQTSISLGDFAITHATITYENSSMIAPAIATHLCFSGNSQFSSLVLLELFEE